MSWHSNNHASSANIKVTMSVLSKSVHMHVHGWYTYVYTVCETCPYTHTSYIRPAVEVSYRLCIRIYKLGMQHDTDD